jgi:type IV secretory pathway VirB2 component (pilin)
MLIKSDSTVSRRTAIFMLFLLVSAAFCFAAMAPKYDQTVNNIDGLSDILNQILGFFRSNYMKAIVSIALGGLAVGMIMNRGEPGMVKKFIPWIAGCTLLLSLAAIVDIVFKNTAAK